MKTSGKILAAFLLNLAFAVFEFAGGLLTGSVAILSDAVHDLADAVSIGASYGLERVSKKQPDARYTYGYSRFSVLGGLLTTAILSVGSVAVIGNAVHRLFVPTPIDYNGMLLFALVGVAVNLAAAWMTRGGDSVNQRAVNLHMLEDVLGWAVVLVGAVVMRLTDLAFLDPLLSIGVAAFIFVHALQNWKQSLALFLEKAPEKPTVQQVQAAAEQVAGVAEVHHIHLWQLDESHVYATMHVVTDREAYAVKQALRHALEALGVDHTVLELERVGEACREKTCTLQVCHHHHGHHHHHHH